MDLGAVARPIEPPRPPAWLWSRQHVVQQGSSSGVLPPTPSLDPQAQVAGYYLLPAVFVCRIDRISSVGIPSLDSGSACGDARQIVTACCVFINFIYLFIYSLPR